MLFRLTHPPYVKKMKKELLDKINAGNANIGVVGLGYVGLPLIKRLNEVGFRTLGLDIDQSKIDAISEGRAYIKHIQVDDLKAAVDNNRCEVTTDFSRVSEVDVIVLCVPTPLNKYREPDLSYIVSSLEALLPHLRCGQMISLESTTYPGTTEEEILPRVESLGFKVGEDIFVVYSPEREDPGNPDFGTHSIPKVCGGITASCNEVGVEFYKMIINEVVSVSSTKVAEMTKILENTFRAVNIGLVNELKIVADEMNIDIFEVINAAKTKPFGYTAFYPGPGLGGHCIPIDPFYLTWKAREFGIHTRFIETAGDINSGMPDYVCAKLMQSLNTVGKSVNGSRVLLLGLAYKKNVDDCRESPCIELFRKLRNLGSDVGYSDPYILSYRLLSKDDCEETFESIQINSETIAGFDAVVVGTDHDLFDWQLIKDSAKLIIDTRGVYSIEHSNVLRA